VNGIVSGTVKWLCGTAISVFGKDLQQAWLNANCSDHGDRPPAGY